MTDSQPYVIVHRMCGHGQFPDADLCDKQEIEFDLLVARRKASSLEWEALQDGRPNDTYRVAELRYVDEEN